MNTVTKVINGHTYTVTRRAPIPAISFFVKFVAITGGGIKDLFEALDKGGSMKNVGESIYSIFTSIYVNDVNCTFIYELLSLTKRDNQDVNCATIDSMYGDNMEEMLDAIYFSAEAHFKPFLSKGVSGFQSAMQNVVGLNSVAS